MPAIDALERFRRRAERRRIVRNVTLGDMEAEQWVSAEPTFVLSTGRCGTKLLTLLLETSDHAAVHHAPRPELVRQSRLAFEQGDTNPALFDEVVRTAREELVLDAIRHGKAYVETNNRITFLAPAIERVFPSARYIHLVRHPADIVRSGIRRGWYSGAHAHDLGRIHPLPGDPLHGDVWDGLDPIARIAWMWQQTNAFIERFLAQVPAARKAFATAEQLFGDVATAASLVEFCNVDAPANTAIATQLKRPVNAQRAGDFPTYDAWTDGQRDVLRDHAPLAATYGYEL
jgi:hypothetical protein